MQNIHFQYFLAFYISLLFVGCEKTDQPVMGGGGTTTGKYTISGRFYQNCSGQPIANTSLVFWQSSVGGAVLGTTNTDANGNFKFSYNPANSNWIDYGVPNQYGYSSYGKISPYKNYSDIQLFSVPTTYLKVSVQAYNTYSNRDTFYITDYRKATPPWTVVVLGPFTSQQLYSVPDYNMLNYAYGDNLMKWGFRINNGDYVYKTDTVRVCDTTRLVAEVR